MDTSAAHASPGPTAHASPGPTAHASTAPTAHARLGSVRALERGIDVLVVALAALVVISAWHAGGYGPAGDGGRVDRPVALPVAVTVLTAVLLAVYGSGLRWTAGHAPGVAQTRAVLGPWVATLVVLWAVLVALEPAALWLAFPLMFLEVHVLGRRLGLGAVALTVAVAVVAALARGQHPVGSVLGPVLGGAVAVGVVLGFETVARESAARARVIEELEATRSDLAAAERARAVAGERERLAREIHDTLAQGFSSVELLLRTVADDLAHGRTEHARPLVDRAGDEARRNLEEARRFVRELRPVDLEAATLEGALRRLADRSAAAGLATTVTVQGTPRRVPPAVETALVRIAQGALANTAEHARATHATLTLTYLEPVPGAVPAEVVLDVVDDGVGFDAAQAWPAAGGPQEREPVHAGGRGFGLGAMTSRANELGGALEVESSPGGGTAVSARVPLDGPTPAGQARP